MSSTLLKQMAYQSCAAQRFFRRWPTRTALDTVDFSSDVVFQLFMFRTQLLHTTGRATDKNLREYRGLNRISRQRRTCPSRVSFVVEATMRL
jgi:hypothetical protein